MMERILFHLLSGGASSFSKIVPKLAQEFLDYVSKVAKIGGIPSLWYLGHVLSQLILKFAEMACGSFSTFPVVLMDRLALETFRDLKPQSVEVKHKRNSYLANLLRTLNKRVEKEGVALLGKMRVRGEALEFPPRTGESDGSGCGGREGVGACACGTCRVLVCVLLC